MIAARDLRSAAARLRVNASDDYARGLDDLMAALDVKPAPAALFDAGEPVSNGGGHLAPAPADDDPEVEAEPGPDDLFA